jgi:hypothetical protein
MMSFWRYSTTPPLQDHSAYHDVARLVCGHCCDELLSLFHHTLQPALPLAHGSGMK